MEQNRFNLWNRITAAMTFVISAFTYLATIEPSASFWDCGEFIASSYKLEVGHPPGNPVFQLIARFFTIFSDNLHAAVMVNAMSALCSALTIFFLYLTIVFFAKRLIAKGEDGRYTTGQALAIFGSGAVGALAYCFSDTFWFSAVEGEVYAMSSLFTALVFWAITRWYDQADERYANRWIVLIAFLMGLSIGVHLLNLLAIPAIVFMYYYRKREDQPYTLWESVKIMLVSVVIVGLLVFLLIPYLPKVAAYFDLFFVNTLGLPYNSGAAFFMLALLTACFWGLFRTLRSGKVFWNTALLCLTMIVVGFSIFSIVIIRSSVKTPTNEYQPDNAFTLVRYLSREQYGSTPLLYGQYFGAPYDIKTTKYWAPLDGKYKKVTGPADADYHADGKMFFPRMWSSSPDGRYEEFYLSYMNGKGRSVPGAEYRKPSFWNNLYFFFDFQLGWMYWRYFMWNFVGRQNDIHAPAADLFYGNWESGIDFIDHMRLGDQSDGPAILSENRGKNHYYFLPLLLGILGLLFQFDRDKRGCWVTFLLFFMTGIAIVLYLNQPPYQVRERDYAYAGSFYAFSIWIGFAVAALYTWISEALKGRGGVAIAALTTLGCLAAPAIMASENWDDHDRSHRYTAVELARNYLESVGKNGILITHGDNDTFPLWYAQEVENIRPDVRIVNTSLLGTDWHIDQMKYAVNESAPLDLTVGPEQYLYGTNESVPIYDTREQALPIADVMAVFKHPQAKVSLSSGRKVDYLVSRRLLIPVNKENVIRSGILDAKYADEIPDQIELTIPAKKDYLSKPELFMLDLLSNYQWDRPLHVLNQGGDLNIGIKDYLAYDGFSWHFVPFKSKITSTSPGFIDPDDLHRKLTGTFCWDALSRTDYYVDYQNLYTFMGVMSQRNMFVNAAEAFLRSDHKDWAEAALDQCQQVMPEQNYPLSSTCLGFAGNDLSVINMVAAYYKTGNAEKARDLAVRFLDDLMVSASFYYDFYDFAKDNFEMCCNLVYYLSREARNAGDTEFADRIEKVLSSLVEVDEKAS